MATTQATFEQLKHAGLDELDPEIARLLGAAREHYRVELRQQLLRAYGFGLLVARPDRGLAYHVVDAQLDALYILVTNVVLSYQAKRRVCRKKLRRATRMQL